MTDFPASVQGDNAVDEICKQLEKLNNYRFDCIVLIRGGGSKLDLDVFNHYKLAKTIGSCPPFQKHPVHYEHNQYINLL